LIFAAVLPTAALIAITGMVGWVGLIMPHIANALRTLNSDNPT
jgi:ABC-type Fe3+-siderophore transport system permease subunit